MFKTMYESDKLIVSAEYNTIGVFMHLPIQSLTLSGHKELFDVAMPQVVEQLKQEGVSTVYTATRMVMTNGFRKLIHKAGFVECGTLPTGFEYFKREV